MSRVIHVCIIAAMVIALYSPTSQAGGFVIVDHCAPHELPVYVTYPIVDSIGPGFGSQAVDLKRQLGTVVRPACLLPDEKRIASWRYEGPSNIHAHDGADVEELPIILQEFYDINVEKDEIIFASDDKISLPGGDSVASNTLRLYQDRVKKRNKSRGMIATK